MEVDEAELEAVYQRLQAAGLRLFTRDLVRAAFKEQAVYDATLTPAAVSPPPTCWACSTPYTDEGRRNADGSCPTCGAEIEMGATALPERYPQEGPPPWVKP